MSYLKHHKATAYLTSKGVPFTAEQLAAAIAAEEITLDHTGAVVVKAGADLHIPGAFQIGKPPHADAHYTEKLRYQRQLESHITLERDLRARDTATTTASTERYPSHDAKPSQKEAFANALEAKLSAPKAEPNDLSARFAAFQAETAAITTADRSERDAIVIQLLQKYNITP